VPHANPHARYDPVRDFKPVANLFRSVKALWVPAALPAQSLQEFVRYATARPGALNYATGGVGSSNHIDAALFARAASLELVHVPYNGPSAAISAVASGDAQMMIVSITTGLPLAQAGKVRPLAVFSATRSALMPDVPTAAEQGFAHLDLDAWMGLVAPAGTAATVVERLHGEVDALLQSRETARWAREQGLEIARGSSAAFARMIEADYERWGEVIRAMGLRQP
jgi:tripartite-type tricarboxylate transporter receptor subunit TctC